jgi:NAD-dependent deacetylase
LAIGTSGTVSPASNYVRSADYAGARTIYINIESLNPRNPYFKEEIIGRAEEILPSIFSY